MTDRENAGLTVRESAAAISETARGVREMAAMIRSQGEMLRIMGERMTAMERTIRTLEKVTPGQVTKINKLIRQRAGDVCEEYRVQGNEKAVAALIRKELKTVTGSQAAREISRCDYEAATDIILGWDDYEAMTRIRRRTGR